MAALAQYAEHEGSCPLGVLEVYDGVVKYVGEVVGKCIGDVRAVVVITLRGVMMSISWISSGLMNKCF